MDITIVIPTYNRKALLKHTLGSIMRSPMSSAPVIVVDNASTDGTQDFLEQYTAVHPTVSYTVQEQRGASAARNKGLSMVQTTWVYFFDSDDEFEDIPHKWDDQAQMIAFPTRQRVDGKVTVRAFNPQPDPAVHILNGMLSTQSMILRTSWLREIGGWNTACPVWNDWELGARVLMAHPRVQWILRPYHTINVHPDSLTGASFKSRYKLQLETIKQLLDETAHTDARTRARCRKALMLRCFILSGKLLYEGDKAASAHCRTFIDNQFGKHPDGRTAGFLLEQFTATGGRGAWKIAVWIMTRKRNL